MKWLCCLPILHSKCNCWRPWHTWPLSKNKHASVHCPARLHLLSPFPLPRSPAYSTRVPPASRRHWSHLAWSSTMLCPARLHGWRVGANLPGCSSLWCRPSFSWSPAAAPLWFVQRTTPAGAAQLRLMPHCGRRHLIPLPSSQAMALRCCWRMNSSNKVRISSDFLPNFHSDPPYDELLWAASAAAIWCIAMSCSCCCYMMNCYELLLLYDELLWAAAAAIWCFQVVLLHDNNQQLGPSNFNK